MRPKAILFAGLILGQTFLVSAAETAPADDKVFKALNDELARSMTLRLEGLEAPYFIQYEVSDATTYQVSASYGALISSDQTRSRNLASQLRVGSNELDNSNFGGGRGGGGRSGLTATAELPTDDDYTAIRQVLWRTTDAQFKEALETLTRKKAYLKEHNVEDRPLDFSKAEPIKSVKEGVSLDFERPAWERYVRLISQRFAELTNIQSAEVDLAAGAVNRYLVNSEGSRLRDGYTESLLRVTIETQSDDGQPFSDRITFFAPTPEKLPPADEILAKASERARQLAQASRAPVLEDYSGPVLFDGLAATQLFRQLLGTGIVGAPDPVGSPRRGGAASDDFDNRIGKRILPQSFQIYDDPRDPQYEGTYLAGHYFVDDEGVPAQRVNIVTEGKLEGMVMSRTPTKHFAQSNGHGRQGGGGSPRSALGCVYIESSKGLSEEELKKELLKAADGEGLKYGLRVTSIQSRAGGGFAGRGRFGRGGGGAGRVVGDPLYVYKVFVSDGHEEMVRGCEFTTLDLQHLRKILAASKTRTVQNNVIGATPSSSIIAPSVLIGEVELAKVKTEGERKPFLLPPQARVGK